MDFVEVGSVRIAYERRGNGDAVLLLHGLPGDSRMWRPQVDALSRSYTVVAWDAPGNGQSSDPDGPIDLSEIARSLARFIERLGLERPHLVGLSWGTGVALELYRIAPSIPRSLVLASGYAGWAGSLPAEQVAQRLAMYLAASEAPREEAMGGWGAGFHSPAAPPGLVEATVELARQSFHPGPFADLARSFARTDLRPVLPRISVPTLVLQAERDTRSPIEVGEALHAAIPGSQLVVLPGVGHVSNLEAPAAFNAEVERFLASTH